MQERGIPINPIGDISLQPCKGVSINGGYLKVVGLYWKIPLKKKDDLGVRLF